MNRNTKLLLVALIACGFVFCNTASAQPAQPNGLSNRVANTTLRMPSVAPVYGYGAVDAFPGFHTIDPVVIATPPGETNRLFIAELRGRIIVITNLANPARTEFLDLTDRVLFGRAQDGDRGFLGLAFHPGYATNGFLYVFYSTPTTAPDENGFREELARFQVSSANPNQALTNSRTVLLSMPHFLGNHAAGCLQFGADGYLYVAMGDGAPPADNQTNSQRIDKDFFSAFLRLDVDKRSGNLLPNPHVAIPSGTTNYLVPADNPFIGATQFNGRAVNPDRVRTEMYAVGFRNPWRFSFDPVTGILYTGDVGGDVPQSREEINVVVKGGNYGWAYVEGTIPGPRSNQVPTGFTSIAPIQEYTHGSSTNQGNSVTGGVVYRGQRIPELNGWYIFADYLSGHIWALKHDGTNTIPFRRLTGNVGIGCFGIDPSNGDVLMGDLSSGTLRRLVFGSTGVDFPSTLAETGAFTNLRTLTPNAGIIPYDLNVPFWSDNAVKTRWFSIPNPALRMVFRATNNYAFPSGAVWIKHFELEMTNGVPESRRRLETRFLVRDTSSGVFGATYRWDDFQTNATLVSEAGLDERFHISDGGVVRTQVWHYPSRAECLACHTSQALGGLALGFNTLQLNRDFTFPNGVTDNQLRALGSAGYFASSSLPTNLYTLRALVHPTNEAASVEARARSWLTANCVMCHQPGGPGQGQFDVRHMTPLSQTRLVNGALVNNGGDTNNRVIVPGSFSHSMLLQRISTRSAGQMPPLASTLVDAEGVEIVTRWITNDLVNYQTFADWQAAHFGSTSIPSATASADPDGDGANNALEYLTSSNPSQPGDAWGIGIEPEGNHVNVLYPRLANRGFEVQWGTNLFGPSSWQVLNVPENRPFFSSTNGLTRVPDVITNAPGGKYYRVRIHEP